jgi:Uma2 family endonuclease
MVRTQNPIHLGRRIEPRPDLAVIRPRADFYRHGHPVAADVLLVIEVSDTTFTYDRDTKAPLYARAGIVEYWIVDVVGARLLVHRGPVDGMYQSVQVVSRAETVQPLSFPDLSIVVADILG